MKGLLVVGMQHRAGEGSVAAALAAVLRRTGTAARAQKILEYDTVASPMIAARHDGDQIDPNAVAASLRDDSEAVIAAAPGGILAALTQRYTLRDLANDLHVPVVLVAPAAPDATNLVRLSLAAARAARVTVAAVVLTGWPDPPSRVQVDERRLLGELAGVTVLTLSESPSARGDDVRDWPVADWLDAIPPEPPPEPPRAARPRPTAGASPTALAAPAPVPTGDLNLEPFAGWEQRDTIDPRTAPRPRIMEAMLEIIAAEGPMRATRAYMLYNRASGGKKLTTTARSPLENSLKWLAQEQKIVRVGADAVPGQDDEIVRMPEQPEVRLREIGDRVLEEVPLDEIAALMRRLRETNRAHGPDELKRAVLSTYGLVRLTGRADDYLNHAIGLL